MKYGRPLFIALIVIAGTGCVPEKPEIVAQSKVGGGQQTAFVVANESFTVDEVRDRVEILPEWAKARFRTADRKKNYLATLTQFELIVDEAERNGFDDHPDTLHRYEEAFARAVIEERLATKPPTEAELRAYFEEHIEDFRTGEARVTYILLTTDEARANELRDRAMAAPSEERVERFGELARNFSLDRASGKRGGLVGAIDDSGHQVEGGEGEFYRPPDDWTGDFVEVPWTLDEGVVSQPLERDGKWLVVLWSATKPAEKVSYESVSDDVRQALLEQRRAELIGSFD